jgi:hypothetical protein
MADEDQTKDQVVHLSIVSSRPEYEIGEGFARGRSTELASPIVTAPSRMGDAMIIFSHDSKRRGPLVSFDV